MVTVNLEKTIHIVGESEEKITQKRKTLMSLGRYPTPTWILVEKVLTALLSTRQTISFRSSIKKYLAFCLLAATATDSKMNNDSFRRNHSSRETSFFVGV